MAQSDAEQLAGTRDEVRFELRLLHERVGALLAAEAFLTIAYTAVQGAGGLRAVVAPVLSVLGLLLALLAWSGVRTTARLVLLWTARTVELLTRHPELQPWPDADPRRRMVDQRRSLLFFRSVPILFVAVWIVLLVVSLVR